MATTSTNRDRAIHLATTILRRLFERVWLPWTPELDAGVARLVDALIDAAAEQLQRRDDSAFLAALVSEPSPPPPPKPVNRYQTVKMRREEFDRPITADDVRKTDQNYAAWERQRRASDERASVGRMLRTVGE